MAELNKNADKFLNLIEEIFGDEITVDKQSYQGSRTKVIVRCNKHDVYYEAWPTNLTRGRKCCMLCAGKLTKLDFITKSREVHGTKYNYDKVDFINTSTKVLVTCPIHGDWSVRPISHYDRGVGCPKCAIDGQKLNSKKFIKKATRIHSSKYCYRHVNVNKNTDIVSIECPLHGLFEQEARVHLSGSNCPTCSKDAVRKTTEQFILDAQAVHGNTYDYSDVVYINNKTKVAINCKRHGVFNVTPNAHLVSRTGCPSCRESYGERLIASYLKDHGIDFKREYKFESSVYRFDFYLHNHNILIEFHGIQHYEPVDRFGGLEGHIQTAGRDIQKMQLSESLNIPLIVLNYLDLAEDNLITSLEKELIRLKVFNSDY